MILDDCHKTLHRDGWSVGEVKTTDGRWIVFGQKGDQRIVGRGPTQTIAWIAVVVSAESISQ